jgi:hypothetical protein
MRIADVFVGKPVPGRIIQIGLPGVVESNGHTLVQKR